VKPASKKETTSISPAEVSRNTKMVIAFGIKAQKTVSKDPQPPHSKTK
jgi:hypothetical protein